jgi:hypothetical protein
LFENEEIAMDLMNVQKYLKDHSLDDLREEFNIIVRDYEDRVVLNYDQIKSPRFHPIVDECRGLILRKGTWGVLARSFDRFYNVGEGEQWKQFPIQYARFDQKLDGSLISVYNDGEQWNVATRGMAYAEGELECGIIFSDLFNMAVKDTGLWGYLETQACDYYTYVFELTSQYNKIVTPYREPSVTLLAIRNNLTGDEFGSEMLNDIALAMGVNQPQPFKFATIEEVIEAAKSLDSMEEGFVLVIERNGSFWRLKCKNPKYVAIAHMRHNGSISPKNVMALVMANDHYEYLEYFPEDKKYFDFCESVWNESLERVKKIAEEDMGIEGQKEFAISINKKAKLKIETGFLFAMRKGEPLDGLLAQYVSKWGAKKAVKAFNLKSKFVKEFGFKEEDFED